MSTTATADGAERRISPRRQPALGTVCRLDGAADRAPLGLVWNISTSGVSMLLDQPPSAGAVLGGHLERMDGGQSVRVTLRVVHVRQIETGDYFIGAQFQRPLAEGEMAPFVA